MRRQFVTEMNSSSICSPFQVLFSGDWSNWSGNSQCIVQMEIYLLESVATISSSCSEVILMGTLPIISTFDNKLHFNLHQHHSQKLKLS